MSRTIVLLALVGILSVHPEASSAQGPAAVCACGRCAFTPSRTPRATGIPPDHPPFHGGGSGVRAVKTWIAELLTQARPASPTLEGLVTRVESTRLIVHVDESAEAHAPWDGRIRFVASAGGCQYVRIELRRLSSSRAAAVLAHELQHALEVAAGEVTSPAEFDALFRRVGFAMRGHGRDLYDTEAAVSVGVDTLEELTGRPARSAGRSARGLRTLRSAAARAPNRSPRSTRR